MVAIIINMGTRLECSKKQHMIVSDFWSLQLGLWSLFVQNEAQRILKNKVKVTQYKRWLQTSKSCAWNSCPQNGGEERISEAVIDLSSIVVSFSTFWKMILNL